MKTGIYRIHNLINDKNYVGKSECRDIEERLQMHKDGVQSNTHLQNSIKKYGIQNFEFLVLEECSTDKCCERERYWIKHFNSNNPKYGYNKTNGGENKTGFKMNPECVKRATETRMRHIQEGLIDCSHSSDTKDKMKDAWSRRKSEGYSMSQETRDKISKANKGRKMSEESKKKISESLSGTNNYWYGKHLPKNVRLKISEARKGMHHSEESRKKMSENCSGELNPMYGKRNELSPHFGKKAMTDGNSTIYVSESEIKHYENLGYTIGKDKAYCDKMSIAKSDKYIYNDIEFYGTYKLIEYLRSNGYPKISQNTIYKLSGGISVRGYNELNGKILRIRRNKNCE